MIGFVQVIIARAGTGAAAAITASKAPSARTRRYIGRAALPDDAAYDAPSGDFAYSGNVQLP